MPHTIVCAVAALLVCFGGLGGCSAVAEPQAAGRTAPPAPSATSATATAALHSTAVPTTAPTMAPTGVPTTAPTAAPTAAPDRWAEYAPYTIDALRARTYGQGQIEIVRVLEDTASFTRYLFAYPSDGLRITGMLEIQSNQAFGAAGDRSGRP